MPIPPDNPTRNLTHANPDTLPHIGLVGDTYTVLLAAKDTAGKYCSSTSTSLPAEALPHTATTSKRPSPSSSARSKPPSAAQKPPSRPAKPSTSPPTPRTSSATPPISPPASSASAPPPDRKTSSPNSPSPVETRTTPPPKPNSEAEFKKKAQELAPKYKTEFLPPPK